MEGRDGRGEAAGARSRRRRHGANGRPPGASRPKDGERHCDEGGEGESDGDRPSRRPDRPRARVRRERSRRTFGAARELLGARDGPRRGTVPESGDPGAQLGVGGRSLLGLAAGHPVDEVGDGAGKVGSLLAEGREGGVEVLVDDREDRGPLERRHRREHLVEDAPERVDVGPEVHPEPAGLLGGEVGRRPDEKAVAGERKIPVTRAANRLGETEVGHVDPALRVDQDVGRLDVPVDDSLLPGGLERVDDLREDRHGLRERKRAFAAEPVGEGLALHQLHDEVGAPVGLPERVQADDPRVLHACQGPGFAEKPRLPLASTREPVPHELDRDPPPQRDVLGEEDRPHPPFAEESENPVARDRRVALRRGRRGRGVGRSRTVPRAVEEADRRRLARAASLGRECPSTAGARAAHGDSPQSTVPHGVRRRVAPDASASPAPPDAGRRHEGPATSACRGAPASQADGSSESS